MARVVQMQHAARPQARAMSQNFFFAWASLGNFLLGFFFGIKAHLQILVALTPASPPLCFSSYGKTVDDEVLSSPG